MSWAVATAAGKDATLALHRAREEGLDVAWSLSVLEGSTGLVRFHGTPHRLVEAQARALALEPVLAETGPAGFEEAFGSLLRALHDRGAEGVVFGNLHLADIREWYERRVRSAGLRHHEPLWGLDPGAAAEAVVNAGFAATVISVNLELGDPAWLGRALDRDLLDELRQAGIDPAGERGEYHTFVHDGPGFASPVGFRSRGILEREGHRFLDLEFAPEA